MSEIMNLVEKNLKEEEDELSGINLSLSLSGEETYRLIELLKGADSRKRLQASEKREEPVPEDNSAYEEAAADVLNEFGIPAHTKGYRCLREALILVAKEPLLVDKVTKCLYPAVAERHGTTPARVERVIRHAIESGCTRGDTRALYHYFSHSISDDKLKPTNAEFIAAMGEVVKKRVSKRQLTFADI